MKLYTYFRSSAAYRVRIALNLKGLRSEHVAVNLVANAQRAGKYLAVNPQGLVPVLADEAGLHSQSLAIIEYLEKTLGVEKDGRLAWYRHWIREGFDALEKMLADPRTGRFCHGDTPTVADVALVPQVFNAQRFSCDLGNYPRIRRINEACLELEAFRAASPANQPDAEEVKGS